MTQKDNEKFNGWQYILIGYIIVICWWLLIALSV